MYDTRLPFGASKSPGIFNRLTQSVRRMMERHGYTVICYLDDFLVVAQTQAQCLPAMHTLSRLLRRLGFAISWK